MANDDVKIRLTADDRTKSGFASANAGLKNLEASATRLKGVFAGLAGAVTVGGLAAIAKKSIDAADALNDMSQRLQVSVKDLASMKLAAEQSGTSLESVGKAIGRLNRSMGEAERGNKIIAQALRDLGVTAKEPKEAFFQLADAVKRIEDPTKRAALLSQVLGKSYEEWIPLLAQGSDELRRSAKASDKYAESMEKLAPLADQFNDELARLKIEAGGAALSILADRGLVRSLADTATRVRELLDEGKGLPALVRLLAGLGKLPWDLVIGDITPAETAAERIRELQIEIGNLERKKKSGDGKLLQMLFGTPEEIDRQILVLKNQIIALEKFGEQVYKPKPAATKPGAGGTLDLSAATAPAKQKTIDQAAAFSNEMERGFDAAEKELKVYDDQAKALAEKIQKQQDFVDGIEQEAFLAGLTNDERETALMLLEAEKLGITDVNRLLEAQGEIRKTNAEKEAAEAIKRQQDDLYQSVQEGVQRGFAAGLDAIAAGEGGWQGALQSLVESLRLAFSNALSASLTDSFLGLLGGKEGVLGMAGSMGLGGKRDGSNPANAVYVQDVAAAVPGADGADGGLLGGLGEMINTMMAGLKAGLTSLVSGFGDLLGGIFGSAGGGQNWLGAIASMFGFADGGYTGPGGKYKPAGIVHAGEYVFSAASVRRLGLAALDNLHRISAGGFVPTMPRWGYADGGLVNLPAQQAGGAGGANIRIVNSIDPAMAGEFFNSPAGEKVFFNLISRNSAAMRQILA